MFNGATAAPNVDYEVTMLSTVPINIPEPTTAVLMSLGSAEWCSPAAEPAATRGLMNGLI